YVDNERNLAIEQLMKRYYRTALAVSQLNELLLQVFNELILEDQENASTTPVNEHFQLRNDAIEVTHPEVFEEYPSALLDIFRVIANRKDIKSVRASTIRLICDNSHLINDAFRNDPRNNRIFMDFLRSPYNIFSQLKRMKRYGILGRYIPAFDHIIGQSQFDLFHIYTVDAHTLLVIKNMRNFQLREQRTPFPIAYYIAQQLPKLELLYLAGLFHDIGKGRGGNHSKLGAEYSTQFCIQHGLNRSDTQLLAWLVQNHLFMSMTAQKKDINDPDVIQSFAKHVGDELKLDYLYALTVADICATNPSLWTTWRASLMRELYRETKRVFRRGLDKPIDGSHRAQDNRSETLVRLAQITDHDVSKEAKTIWSDLSDDYFLRESPSDIAWHTDGIIRHTSDKPLVLIRETSNRKFDGGTQIFIYTEDRPNLFAVMVSTLEQLHLSVVDARIITSHSNFSLDTYIVLDEDGTPIGDDSYRNELIHKTLEEALRNPAISPDLINHRLPRQLKNFAPNTRIKLQNSQHNRHSILEVNTLDRPGVLAQISLILAQMNITVLNARITTLGERADDIFFVVDKSGENIAEKEIGKQLKEKLCKVLNQLDADCT
ncbi:MAG: [protein-PII] uridylyltransferase, partial [Pseudomonadales bacterium]|nr:[protein-PII] uridylyltransferase [Pseudomonadales bacterium]